MEARHGIGGTDRRVVKDGVCEQPEMGHGCDATVLEKAASGGCDAWDERAALCSCAVEDERFFFLD